MTALAVRTAARTRLRVLFPLVFLLLVVTSCVQPQPIQITSLRIVTYNTHLISPGMRCLPGIDTEALGISGGIGAFAGDWTGFAITLAANSFTLAECLIHADGIAPAEAEILAANLLKRNEDVIALNEVFDEDAKDVLIAALEPIYPHYVRYVTEGIALEDSGLMLFSRYPFAPLIDDTFRATDLQATSNEVAFIRHSACASVDCFSGKGAALVSVRIPGAFAPLDVYTIAFTHMQADYGTPGEHTSVRERQFADIVDLVRITLDREQLHDTAVIITGDLNIEGSRGVFDAMANTATGSGAEWQNFATDNAFRWGLYDAWAATTSAQDVGITHPSDNQRLDYVVMGHLLTMGRACVQHTTIQYLGESDHVAVTADINRDNYYCDPRRAWVNPPLDQLLNVNPAISSAIDSTQLVSGGSMQWFHVTLDEPATVSVVAEPSGNIVSGGVDIEIYAPNNLSVPIPWYLQETTRVRIGRQTFTGKKFVVPQEFYIRVFSPNRLWSGDYTLAIHKHNCQNANDACVLQVNNPTVYRNVFKPNVLLGLDDTAWFQIDVTDRADSGAAQHLRLFADSYVPDLFRFELRDKAAPAVPLTLAGEVITSMPALHQIEADEVGPRSMYLLAQRQDVTRGSYIRAGWESNLTRMHGLNLPIPGGLPMKLVCVDETNGAFGSEAGDDEIHFLVNVDNTGWQEVLYHDYDCNNEPASVTLDNPAHVWRFLNNVQVKLVEEDGSINPDDPGPVATINALPINIFPPTQVIAPAPDVRVVNLSGTWTFEGGEYRLEYSLSHQVRAQ